MTRPPASPGSHPLEGADLPLPVSAAFLGNRLDVRGLADRDVVAWTPLLIRTGERGLAALFRYGVVVAFNLSPDEEAELIEELRPHVRGDFGVTETERATLAVDADQQEHVDPTGAIWLRDLEPPRLQIVAEVLAKSTALAHYEREAARVFDHIEPLVDEMRLAGRAIGGQKRLLRQLGAAMMTQARIIGRLEAEEKPDLAWEDPTLDRLYERLSTEYELSERHRILARKTDFTSDSVGLLIGMAHQHQSIRLEWYIVVLILVEIVFLILYEVLA